jgi:hypothetical protein
VVFEKTAHSNPENSAKKNVCVEHKTLRVCHCLCWARHRSKSATASFSDIPSASRISCQRAAASFNASLSASLLLRRAVAYIVIDEEEEVLRIISARGVTRQERIEI